MSEMIYFYPEGHADHFEAGHPERPERVEAILNALRSAGWWEGHRQLAPLAIPDQVLHAVHTPRYLQYLKETCRRGAPLDSDTYTTPRSWELALQAAGGAAALAVEVWQSGAELTSERRRGFALTRPPGHHATSERGMGFCLLNNVALAAEYLIQIKGARRLAIVDLDLHHGNGTQDIFWRRNDVFYISTHQSPLYPGSGRLEEIGSGPGEGYTANFPLPPATGDVGFQTIMQELISPLLDRYQAEMLLVSVGFDPHWKDPLGHLQLSAAGFGNLIAHLVHWADHNCTGRIAFFLEGGYDLDAGAACGQALVAACLGQPWEDFLGPSPYPEGKSWQAVARRAREIWAI